MLSEPAHIRDLWEPGSPRHPGEYTLDGFCLLCGKLVPSTMVTLLPVGLMCVRCQIDLLPPRRRWREWASRRAGRLIRDLVGRGGP